MLAAAAGRCCLRAASAAAAGDLWRRAEIWSCWRVLHSARRVPRNRRRHPTWRGRRCCAARRPRVRIRWRVLRRRGAVLRPAWIDSGEGGRGKAACQVAFHGASSLGSLHRQLRRPLRWQSSARARRSWNCRHSRGGRVLRRCGRVLRPARSKGRQTTQVDRQLSGCSAQAHGRCADGGR